MRYDRARRRRSGWFGGRGFKATRLEWDKWAPGPHASLTVAAPDGPDATSRPAVAASWKVDDSHALALANSAGASSCGRIVLTDGDANARAVPTRASRE